MLSSGVEVGLGVAVEGRRVAVGFGTVGVGGTTVGVGVGVAVTAGVGLGRAFGRVLVTVMSRLANGSGVSVTSSPSSRDQILCRSSTVTRFSERSR